MEIKKEKDVVMEVHKQKDSKIHKKAESKVKTKDFSMRVKGGANATGRMVEKLVLDNIEGGENIEVGKTIIHPAKDMVSAGNTIRKKVQKKIIGKETTGRIRKRQVKKEKISKENSKRDDEKSCEGNSKSCN